MGYILSNIGPILAATSIGLVIGLLYVVASGETAFLRRRPIFWILAALAEFWLASILAGALILAPDQAGRWVMAIGSAVVIWIGFVVPALGVTQGFRDRRAWMTVRDLLHWLAVMVVQAAVLEAIGLHHP